MLGRRVRNLHGQLVLAGVLVVFAGAVSASPAQAGRWHWFGSDVRRADLDGIETFEEETEHLQGLIPATTEDRFRGQDPRYLHLLRAFAGAITVVADGSVELHTGSRWVWHMDEDSYRAEVAREEQYGSMTLDERDHPHFSQSGDSKRPYRIETQWTNNYTRLLASPRRLRIEIHFRREGGNGYHVVQRAWGGLQGWTMLPERPDDTGVWLAPAYTRFGQLFMIHAWIGERHLTEALQYLLEQGPPTRIQEQSDAQGARVVMQWTSIDGRQVSIATDPRRAFVPQEWETVDVRNEFQQLVEMLNQSHNRDPPLPLPPAELNALLRKKKEAIGYFDWEAHPYVERRDTYTFTGWRRRANGAWFPRRIERTWEEQRVDAEGQPLDLPMPGAQQTVEDVEWDEWQHVRGRVSPREVFADPPGYELYAGQQWVNMVLPHDKALRRDRVDELVEALSLVAGMDLEDNPRWIVNAVDSARIGAWPVQAGDVILEYRPGGLGLFRAASPERHRTPEELLNQAAAALRRPSAETPAHLRLARGDLIVDIACWTPDSNAAVDLAVVHERIARSRVYAPLPYEPALALAEAVLDATKLLVQGAGE